MLLMLIIIKSTCSILQFVHFKVKGVWVMIYLKQIWTRSTCTTSETIYKTYKSTKIIKAILFGNQVQNENSCYISLVNLNFTKMSIPLFFECHDTNPPVYLCIFNSVSSLALQADSCHDQVLKYQYMCIESFYTAC